MSRPLRFLSALTAALSIASASCALTPVGSTTLIIPPYIDAREAVGVLSDAQDTICSIRGTVTLKTFDENDSPTNSVTGYMAYEYPDKVRFTYIGPLGMVLFEALVNDETMILFLPQQLLAYKGKTTTPKNGPFSPKLMSLPFSRPMGSIFVIEHDGPLSTLYGIAGTDQDFVLAEKIIIDRLTMRPTIREGYENGLLTYLVQYRAYESVDGISVPTDIAVKDLKSGASMEILLRDFTVNTDLSEEVFDTTVRSPYSEKPLDSFVPPDY